MSNIVIYIVFSSFFTFYLTSKVWDWN